MSILPRERIPVQGSGHSALRVVPALGLTQIVGWGSLYYSIAVLAQPMSRDIAVSPSIVFGAFSLALIASGLASPRIGRAIDQHGGRTIMSCGSLVAALALSLIALSHQLVFFLAGWCLAGIAMSATLYDAAFPTLRQLTGSERYRSALTALTLFGGLASTAFWPLSYALENAHGWRMALLCFAALNLVCAGIHWLALPAMTTQAASHAAQKATLQSLPHGFVLLTTAFALNAFVFAALGAHVIGALSAVTASAADAVWAAALIGPMQVAGRMLEFAVGRHLPATKVGAVSFAVVVAGVMLLWAAGINPWMPVLFALVYGAANGVMTIARGAVPAELYALHGYGEVMGHMARPAFFAKAIAPVTVSLLLDQGAGYAFVSLLLALLSGLALCAYAMALRAHKRY